MNRSQIQKQFATINRRYENKFFFPVKAALIPDGLIAAIRKGGAEAGRAHLHGVIHNTQLSNVIRSLYVTVGLRHAQLNYSRMRSEARLLPTKSKKILTHKEFKSVAEFVFTTKGFGNNPTWEQFIINYLQQFLLQQITFEVATTTRDAMLEVLAQAIKEGWSIDETVKRLEDLPFTTSQAARIVRTEINRAANVGAKAQSQTFQYEQMKEWISAEDDRVRGNDPKDHASHVALDGQRINEGDVFRDPRNGDLLEFPGDLRASAESTINCRCAVAYVAKRDQNGRLIPKSQTTNVIFPNQNRPRQTILV